MSSTPTNFCHSFIKTLIHIWTVVLSWCSFRHPDIVVDLERGIQKPQPAQPVPGAVTLSPCCFLSASLDESSSPTEYATTSFHHTSYPLLAVNSRPYLPQRIVTQSHGPELNVTNRKFVDGRTVPTSLSVEDDMSASGTNTKHPVSASRDASGKSIIYNDNITRKYKDSPCRSSISTSTSTPSLHVPSFSYVFRDDQNFRSSRRALSGHPHSPLTFPSRHRYGKGHKRAPLAIITNISHVMGPSSPVIETFTIPKPSSAIPLAAPMACRPRALSPTPPPLINNVADQATAVLSPIHSAPSSPRHTSSAIIATPGPALIPVTPTSERSLRRVPAFDDLHSLSPSRRSQKACPSLNSRQRPVSSVVWFKDPGVTPATPLRIAKGCVGLYPSLSTVKTARKVRVTEEELEEEVSAVKKAFATIRDEGGDDDGVTARERFNRASVWTMRTNRSSVFHLDDYMRNVLDEEESDDDDTDEEGYGEELSSPSLIMRSPPPPYPLSPHSADKKTDYKIPTSDSLPPVSKSTELSYLRSPTPSSSLDDLLLSFEDLIASMPSRLRIPEEMRRVLAEKEGKMAKASERVFSKKQEENGETACLALKEDMVITCRSILEKVDDGAPAVRDRHWSDDFELDAYVEAS